MIRTRLAWLSIVLILSLSAACTPGWLAPNLPDEAALSTAAAQTVAAQQTQSNYETMVARLSATPEPTATRTPVLTSTPKPTATLMPTATVPSPTATLDAAQVTPILPATPTRQRLVFLPSPTSTQLPCNWAEFIEDVTVPDGTVFAPGKAFTKTWRVKNIGSCEWTWDYEIIFSHGDTMGGPAVQKLDKIVLPDQTVEIEMELLAPYVQGTYTGFWMLRSNQGEVFGMGRRTDSPMWARIEVDSTIVEGEEGEELVYEFVTKVCEAKWFSNHGNVNCPTDMDDAIKGYVDFTDEAIFEDGIQAPKWAIVMMPGDGNKGYITGRFPPVRIHDGNDFSTLLGCAYDRPDCDVEARIDYSVAGGPVQNLGTWRQKADGKLNEILLDLNQFDGKTVEFIFHVTNLGSREDARIIWMMPTIR